MRSTRTRDEVAAAIRSLTVADSARLKMVARKYSFGRPIDPEDLLQEAFVRALVSRACPADVDVVKFLAESIRSIGHGEAEKAEHKVSLAHIDGASSIRDATDDAETRMIATEYAQRCAAAYAEIVALFNDDLNAQLILEGMREGMTPEDMRTLTGLDNLAYATKRKLIRRRIDKHYPEGWKP